jgi:hypothetical protein
VTLGEIAADMREGPLALALAVGAGLQGDGLDILGCMSPRSFVGNSVR